jgi:hypothetical protein
MNEQQITVLRKIAVWTPRSFPSGVSYRKQALPLGTHDGGVQIRKGLYGYEVAFPDGLETTIRYETAPNEAGDRVLTALRPVA